MVTSVEKISDALDQIPALEHHTLANLKAAVDQQLLSEETTSFAAALFSGDASDLSTAQRIAVKISQVAPLWLARAIFFIFRFNQSYIDIARATVVCQLQIAVESQHLKKEQARRDQENLIKLIKDPNILKIANFIATLQKRTDHPAEREGYDSVVEVFNRDKLNGTIVKDNVDFIVAELLRKGLMGTQKTALKSVQVGTFVSRLSVLEVNVVGFSIEELSSAILDAELSSAPPLDFSNSAVNKRLLDLALIEILTTIQQFGSNKHGGTVVILEDMQTAEVATNSQLIVSDPRATSTVRQDCTAAEILCPRTQLSQSDLRKQEEINQLNLEAFLKQKTAACQELNYSSATNPTSQRWAVQMMPGVFFNAPPEWHTCVLENLFVGNVTESTDTQYDQVIICGPKLKVSQQTAFNTWSLPLVLSGDATQKTTMSGDSFFVDKKAIIDGTEEGEVVYDRAVQLPDDALGSSPLAEAVMAIDKALCQGKKVLIGCQQGKDRSVAVTVAYIMWKFRVSNDKAYACVLKERICGEKEDGVANLGFTSALQRWETFCMCSQK